ncbi:hypothetical protein [Vampirovibrio sp.]|uniref:hypothetical protein n=1 Tax=Vampirovibrio sp. TaxID=2717857 RepID=UPI00359467FC
MALALLLTALFYKTPALSAPRWSREVFVWPLTFALIFLYWQGAKTVLAETTPLKRIGWSGVLWAVLAVLIPAFHSTDIYGYINRGWQQLHYGLNPYVFTIDHIPNWHADPMITNHWVNNPSPYGFLYLLIAKLLCWVGQGNKALTVLVFKGFNALLYLGTAALIWLGARHLEQKGPDTVRERFNPNWAVYLYLWNPLVLIHSLGNGHNDMLMGFFVTLAALSALLGGWFWILPALMAATLIKYGALVILPLAFLFLLKNKAWVALGAGLALAILVFAVTGLPYLPDWRQFHLAEINHNAFVSHGSLHSFVYSLFKYIDKTILPALHPHREWVRGILKNGLLGAYALFFAGLCWRRFRQSGYPASQWIQDALLVMAVLIGLISLKFYPWYLGMFFPLVFYLPHEHWLRRLLIPLSCAQLFSITFIGQAHLLNFLVMTALPILWFLWKQKTDKPLPVSGSGSEVA